jgi:phosphatidylglycerophosphate synthase
MSEQRDHFIKNYYRLMEKLVTASGLTRLSPNTISAIATLLGFTAAFFFFTNHTFTAGAFLLMSGLLDTMDGTVARLTQRASKFGAIIDSSLDRYVEFSLYLGLLNLYRNDWMFYTVYAAMVGSIMVSYARARAASLGVNEIVGLMQRPERLILLAAGAIINAPVHLWLNTDWTLRGTLLIIAVFSNTTALRRIWIVKKAEDRSRKTPIK